MKPSQTSWSHVERGNECCKSQMISLLSIPPVAAQGRLHTQLLRHEYNRSELSECGDTLLAEIQKQLVDLSERQDFIHD